MPVQQSITGGTAAPPQPIGGSRDIERMRGELGLLSGKAVEREMRKVMQEQIVTAQAINRAADRMVEATEKNAQIQEQALRGLSDHMSRTITEMAYQTIQAAPPGYPSPGRRDVAPEEVAPAPRAPGARVAPGVVDPVTQQPPTEARVRTPQEIYDATRNFSMRDVRSAAGRAVGQRLSGLQAREPENYTQGASGDWRWTGGEGLLGGVVEDPESNPEIARYLASARNISRVKDIVSGVASGQPVGNAIIGNIPAIAKVAGVAGLAYQGVNQVLDFAEGQRQQNLGYQQVLGGGNIEGFGERARRNMFELANRGGIGSAAAGELYEGALQTYGTDRERRSEAERFGRDAMLQFGMTVRDSMALVNAAAQSSGSSLGALSNSLERVTEGAREAGINAETMRDQFISTYQGIAGVVSGAAQTALAESITMNQIGMGRRMSDLDYSQQFQGNNLFLQAAQAGMTPGEYAAQINAGPEGAALASQTAFAVERRAVENVTTPQVRDYITQQFEAAGGLEQYRNDPNNQIFSDIARDIQNREIMGNAVLDPMRVQELVTQMGGPTNLSLAEASEYVVRNLARDPGREAEQLEQTQIAARASDVNIEDAEGNLLPEGTRDLEEMRDIKERIGLKLRPGQTYEDQSNLWGRESVTLKNQKRAYMRHVRDTGERLPVIEQILERGDLTENSRVRVRVEGPEGFEERDVSMQEAIEHFSDQLQRGTASIETDEGMGFEQIADQFTAQSDYGYDEEGNFVGDRTDIDTDEDLAQMGESAREADERRQREGGSTRVLVEPTDELRRWIRQVESESSDPYNHEGVPAPARPTPGRP